MPKKQINNKKTRAQSLNFSNKHDILKILIYLNMNRGQEILIMSVDISDTKKDKIIVHEYDSPEILARDFIQKYNLNPQIIDGLAKEIYYNISDLLKAPQNIYSQPAYQENILSQFKLSDSSEGNNSENYGEKLYFKGLKKLEKNQNMKQALKMRIEQEENRELTFKPKINPVSNVIAQRMANRSQDSIRKKESIIAKCQTEKKEEEQSACTFAPRINPNSNKMLEHKKRSSSNRFIELYEEANTRKQRQESVLRQNEFSFKPELCNNHGISSSGERLYFKKNFEDLNNSSKIDDLKDPKTGQDLFTPQINKGIYYRNRELPIGEHLYSMQRKNIEPDDFSRNPNLEAKKRSEELVKRAKKLRYKEIFEQLNPDDKGIIYHERIDKKYVEPIVFKLMQPLLEELRAGNETLDFEQFSSSMDNLLKILSQDEKNVFLIYKRGKEEISVSSSIKKSGSISEIEGVYRRQVEKKINSQAKLELEREKKHRNELEGCTFHPQTTPYRVFNSRIDIS